MDAADLAAWTKALDDIELDDQRARWRNDPVAWVEERLGEYLWSRQRDIMRSVAEHPLTAVQSGHGIGKSHLASRLVGWFLDTRPVGETFVVTTAPNSHQVKVVLWRYIQQMHTQHGLPGRITQGQVPEWKLGNQVVAYGRKPADHDDSGFQGVHAKHLLIILDEACGIPKQLWDAADSLATGSDNHILAIGNPDSNSSHFHTVCTAEPGWSRIQISSLDSPNFTGEPVPDHLTDNLVQRAWVENKRLRWGASSSLYKAKILGEWADDEDALIPLAWVKAANQRWHDWNEDPTKQSLLGRTVFGVDVATTGADQTVIATRKGDVVLKCESWSQRDTIEIATLVEQRCKDWVSPTAVVDCIGSGVGVVDQLRVRGISVVRFNASETVGKLRDSTDSIGFINVRAAAWWHMRELLDPAMDARLALPPDDDLTADLITPRFEPVTGGKIKIESKDDIRKRLGRSTDSGDAVVQAMYVEQYERQHAIPQPELRPLDYEDQTGGWD